MKPSLFKLLLCAAMVASPASAADSLTTVPGADKITSKTLPNGLKVVVWSDHDIPNVALYNWYKVGSRNEYAGITGISHFFEHMMFNGTSKRKPGEFDRVMEANGGANNAYTSNDVTVYQDWFPRTALDLIFDLEGDRMANLDFDPKVVESERGVVYSERRSSVDNSNFGALIEQIDATAFTAHPYQIPTVGWPSDIEGWKVDDLKTYYHTYYAPNNAVMFVVGDVEPEEIFTLAEKYLGKTPAQATPRPVTTKEPEQQGERRVNLVREAESPLLVFAHHSISGADADAPATKLLMAILADGNSSRLHQQLVEQQQLVVNVGQSLSLGFDPGLSYLYVTLPPGGDLDKVEKALDAELQKIATDGVTEAELNKVRTQKLADFWRNMSTISGKAQQLGSYEVFQGDYKKLFDAPASYEKVSAADLKRIAGKLFRRNNRTVGTLVPTKK
ncbi:MAG: pitrilysin family protein [Arenimonas sp.]